MTAQSRYLGLRQLRALERLGDILLPGYGDMPRFSETGSLAHVDELLAAAPAADVRDLRLLLTVLAWMPDWALRALLNLIERRERLPNLLAAPLRLLNLGLKGVLLSLYYSGLPGPYSQGPSVLDIMEYQLNCEPQSGRNPT